MKERKPQFTIEPQGPHCNSSISLEDCLEATKDFKDQFPEMKILKYNDKITIVDEAAIGIGFKARAASFALMNRPENVITYVATRMGYAPVSLAYMCKALGKRLILVAPACKEISEHQAAAVELGAEIRFIRVVAMPNANKVAQELADALGGYYFKGGLKDDDVFKGAVRVLYDNLGHLNIKKMWLVTSTGVLARSLQTALPNTEFQTVAVSRNIKDGDIGRVKAVGYHKPFLKNADYLTPDFDSCNAYDAKALEYLLESGEEAYFFSVAGEMAPTTMDKAGLNSWIEWNDLSQFPEVLEARKLNKQPTLF